MKHIHDEGETFRIITFTVKTRCHKDMDVVDELDSASIYLLHDNLHFELNGSKHAYYKTDLMTLMTYNTMGEEYTGQMLNETRNKAYQEHILSLSMSSAKKEKMKKLVLVVKMTLEYPPHGEFK